VGYESINRRGGFHKGAVFWGELNQEGVKNIFAGDHLDNSKKWENLVDKVFYDYI
jgi:hypothetical protein